MQLATRLANVMYILTRHSWRDKVKETTRQKLDFAMPPLRPSRRRSQSKSNELPVSPSEWVGMSGMLQYRDEVVGGLDVCQARKASDLLGK